MPEVTQQTETRSNSIQPRIKVLSHPVDGNAQVSPKPGGGQTAVVHRVDTPGLPHPVKPLSIGKRALDLLLASSSLVLFSPLLLGLALFIRLTAGGPVLFRHRRFGWGEQPFEVLKFRTMHPATNPAEHAAYVQRLVEQRATMKKRDGDRLIFGGQLIRDLGLDELPQLINVLRGEMSIVGPRPDVFRPESLEVAERARYTVLPGITGLWQISGKNRLSFRRMIELDCAYARQPSLACDLWIILVTPIRILGQFLPGRCSE